MSDQKSQFRAVLKEVIAKAFTKGYDAPLTDQEIEAWEAKLAALKAEEAAGEAALLQRSGMTDIKIFKEMTAMTPREMFALEMRTTPENYMLRYPDNPDLVRGFGLTPPQQGADVELTPREQFIIAYHMTPEAHAFQEPENHDAAIKKFFPDGESPYSGLS